MTRIGSASVPAFREIVRSISPNAGNEGASTESSVLTCPLEGRKEGRKEGVGWD
jgi:hypothetical protein